MNEFLRICDEIGFPVSPEKTVWATTIIVFLGILIDTLQQTISVPVEKRQKAIELLSAMINSCTTMVLKLQQLTGLLNFLATAIVPGRKFTQRMYTKYA